MKAFLKENIILIAGITLPLLIAVMFFVALQIGKISTEPPAYKLIFANETYNSKRGPYQITVTNEQIKFKYVPLDTDKRKSRYDIPKLYVYDPVSNVSHEVNLPEIEINNDWDKEIILPITELKSAKISTKSESPDGYKFERSSRGSSNLMTEMFGGGYRYKRSHFLVKNSRKIMVPETKSYNTEFIGWIIEESK